MGEEIYSLHDNGRKLFTTARECTPIQRFVYVFAKSEHTDNVDTDPGGMDKVNRFNDATGSF
jgi:hypothetical protein